MYTIEVSLWTIATDSMNQIYEWIELGENFFVHTFENLSGKLYSSLLR